VTKDIKSHIKIVICTILVVLVLCFGLPFLNWFFGYHGYEKEKYRRNSEGNRNESIYRNAFVKDLGTKSNLKLDSFEIFIERGYKYGYFSADKTNFLSDESKYPFQISHTDRTDNNLVVYSFVKGNKSDSIGGHLELYLKEPIISDTLKMRVEKFRMAKENGRDKAVWDSIGYIKVFENK
jgi:hypothetical protein